ncbi:MAG TPA: chromate efflux transporter [Noviherbaspirillum sp.]|uniref:chromate efflux transporter n=1 Tax=Noviherbaspirillum sp. TaxID=1926288 RepID=UPI002F92B074
MQRAPSTPPPAVSLREAFRYWLKLGFISFGGPAGQIAIMHADLVERRRWISEQRFLHALNYCMLLPGPEATQLAIYIGWLMHRTAGGVIAGVLFVLPSLLTLGLLSWVYLAYGHLALIAGMLYGIKPAVVAIVLAAAWRIGSRTLRNRLLVAIALAAFAAILAGLPFPAIVLGAGIIGLFGGRLLPDGFRTVHRTGRTPSMAHPPALIDDDTPTPAHARNTAAHVVMPAVAGIILGAVAWACLAWQYGTGSTLAGMAWFFTKAAFMTFGGAYAVLPYVYQGAVDAFQWLTPAQMIDGLALGETTPGPLIMVVAFVGFVGGWTKALFGPDALLLAGAAGAAVATFFTFLPSFVFILAGGPVVESTRGDIRFTAPLTAISAAVVGVMLSLAVFFAEHVFRLKAPYPDWDFGAMAITAGAALALLRWKVGTITLIGGCAVLGLVLSYLR